MDNQTLTNALVKLGNKLATAEANQAILEAQTEAKDEKIKQLEQELEQLKNKDNKEGGNH